jgi:Phasin protein
MQFLMKSFGEQSLAEAYTKTTADAQKKPLSGMSWVGMGGFKPFAARDRGSKWRPRAIFQGCGCDCETDRGGGSRVWGKLFRYRSMDDDTFPWLGDLNKKLQSYAEQHFAACLEFSHRLSQAKDFQDFAQIEIEFFQERLRLFAEQARDFSEAYSKSAVSAIKAPFYCLPDQAESSELYFMPRFYNLALTPTVLSRGFEQTGSTELLAGYGWSAAKVVGVSADFALLARCECDLHAALANEASVVRSQPYCLDITYPLANKGYALSEPERLSSAPAFQVRQLD